MTPESAKPESIAPNIGRLLLQGIFASARFVPIALGTGLAPSIGLSCNSSPLPVSSTSAAPRLAELTMDGIERLTSAAFVAPSTIQLEFVDRRGFALAIDLLGMPADRIDWPTLRPSPNGDKVVVKWTKGEPIPIDSATLRYLVDKKYAAKMDATLKSLQFTEEELERMVRENPPPDAWFDEPESDSAHESWK